MRRAINIQSDSQQIETVRDLTSVFESIASIQVAKIKHKAELSKEFFQLLWSHYIALRVDPSSWITQRSGVEGDRQVFIMISAESGLSGNIDQRLIERMIRDYDPKTTDIIVLGTHGASQLAQRNIPYSRHFQVPETDSYIDVSPIANAILPYARAVIYYEEYISLGVQEIARLDLHATMEDLGKDAVQGADIDFSRTVFEPSIESIVEQMEITMTNLTLSQAILESSLAQAASRFNAMAVAKKHATELIGEYSLEYHRAKRSESDRRLREIMVTLKKRRRSAQGGL